MTTYTTAGHAQSGAQTTADAGALAMSLAAAGALSWRSPRGGGRWRRWWSAWDGLRDRCCRWCRLGTSMRGAGSGHCGGALWKCCFHLVRLWNGSSIPGNSLGRRRQRPVYGSSDRSSRFRGQHLRRSAPGKSRGFAMIRLSLETKGWGDVFPRLVEFSLFSSLLKARPWPLSLRRRTSCSTSRWFLLCIEGRISVFLTVRLFLSLRSSSCLLELDVSP